MRLLSPNVFLVSPLLVLAACGGSSQDIAASSATKLLAQVSVVNGKATFTGNRGNYTITAQNGGFNVVDRVGIDGVNFVNGAQTLQFADVNINTALVAKAASISATDLTSLIELYIAYFNRVPDADGLGYWIDQFKAGQSLEQIGLSFYSAAVQFSTLTGYSANMTNADFVKVIYKNVLGRANPDQEGLDYWSINLNRGTETRGTLIKAILYSAHTFKGDVTYGSVADMLDNKTIVAKYFAVQQGLNFNTSSASIAQGIAIASAITATDTAIALAMVPKNYQTSGISPESVGSPIASTYNAYHYNQTTLTPQIATLVDRGLGQTGTMTLGSSTINFIPSAVGDGAVSYGSPITYGMAFNQLTSDRNLPVVAMQCQSVAGQGSNRGKSTDVLVSTTATLLTSAATLANLTFGNYYEDCYKDGSPAGTIPSSSISFDAQGNAKLIVPTDTTVTTQTAPATTITSMLNGNPNDVLVPGGRYWLQAYSYVSNGLTKYALVVRARPLSDPSRGIATVYLQ